MRCETDRLCGCCGGDILCQAEDGIRDLVRSRGLGDVYKRQPLKATTFSTAGSALMIPTTLVSFFCMSWNEMLWSCLLYTSDAADERSSVDLGGRRIIKKKTMRVAALGTLTLSNTTLYASLSKSLLYH